MGRITNYQNQIGHLQELQTKAREEIRRQAEIIARQKAQIADLKKQLLDSLQAVAA